MTNQREQNELTPAQKLIVQEEAEMVQVLSLQCEWLDSGKVGCCPELADYRDRIEAQREQEEARMNAHARQWASLRRRRPRSVSEVPE